MERFDIERPQHLSRPTGTKTRVESKRRTHVPTYRLCKKKFPNQACKRPARFFLSFSLSLSHFPPATLMNFTRPHLSIPPPSNHRPKLRHWLTSNFVSRTQPSTMLSTPVPVTRTQPRTDSSCRSSRCRPMERRDWSDTALPQKERFKCVSEGQPRERTSVEVSERAQQKD